MTEQANSVHDQKAMWGKSQGRDDRSKSKPASGDKYVAYDEEQEGYVTGYHSVDELNANLDELGKTKASFVKEFNVLNEFESMQVFNSFKSEAQAIIDEVNSLKGALYTEEGKKAEIAKRLKELAEDKKNEADNVVKDHQERHANLLDNMEKELNKYDNSLTSDQVAEINLRNNELQGQIRGKLYRFNDTRTLEHEFKTLVEQSKHDKTLARFLENNYYMFLDKVQTLDTGEMDKQRATQIIMVQANKLKESNYSSKERALMAVKENLKGKNYHPTASKRQIDNHLNAFLRKYK